MKLNMATYFDTVKDGVKKTAEKAYAKANELVEVTKINFNINELESQIDKNCKTLGFNIYNDYKNNVMFSEEVMAVCQDIDEKYNEIKNLKMELAELKKVRKCTKCGRDNPFEANYCISCGSMFGNFENEPASQETAAPTTNINVEIIDSNDDITD